MTIRQISNPNTDIQFDLAVTFWGESYSGYFLDICLRSLLAPKNLPELAGITVVRLLICTTECDFEYISSSKIYTKKYFTSIEFIRMGSPGKDESRYSVMSSGHKRLIEEMSASQSIGILLAPDMLCANGYISQIMNYFHEGCEMVLAPGLRFDMARVMDGLSKGQYISEDGAMISISSSELAKKALESMHPETQAYNLDGDRFAHYPVSAFIDVKGSGIVLHTLSWAAIMVDYRAFDELDLTSLDCWTIDGDFVDRNIDQVKNIFVERDSDNLFFAPLTLASEGDNESLQPWFEIVPVLRKWSRLKSVRYVLYDILSDPTKRSLFREPIFIHYTAIDEKWTTSISRASDFIQAALSEEPSANERWWLRNHSKVREGVFKHMRYWLQNRLKERSI